MKVSSEKYNFFNTFMFEIAWRNNVNNINDSISSL